ncbi:MAG: quinoprotein relay system zinc metallohydrolase 2 [Pseudomonadota bacterium]
MLFKPENHRTFEWIGLKIIVFIMFFVSFHSHAVDIKLVEVAPGIHVHQGQHHSIDHSDREDIANIGYIEGNDCIAVIDTGGSIAVGNALYKSIKKQTDVPICYVINSHIHFDHLLGNVAFKSPETRFIGHVNLRDELQTDKSFFTENFLDELNGQNDPDLIIAPDQVVETELELDLGNRKILITAHPTAHTHTDLSIYDYQTKTIWLSDLLFVERTPVIDGSLKGWLTVLDEIEKNDIEFVIAGHGRLDIPPDEAMTKQKEYLVSILEETRAMIAQGAFMEEVIEQVGQGQKENWLLFDEQHRRNVSRAFVELEWE